MSLILAMMWEKWWHPEILKKCNSRCLTCLEMNKKIRKMFQWKKMIFLKLSRKILKNSVRKFRTNLEKTMRFIRGHFLIEILIFDYISATCFKKITANFESFLIIKRFHRWSKSDPQFRNIRSAVPRLNILKSWTVSQELERESKYFYSIRSDERFEFICRQSRIQKGD